MASDKAGLDALRDLLDVPEPTLGIDIDGCIDEAQFLFGTLSRIWPGKVIIISARGEANREKALADLESFGTRFDELILVESLQDKARVIVEKGVAIFFDDQPECLQHIPPTVNVCLVRNNGNFDFDTKRWMMSQQTGQLVN